MTEEHRPASTEIVYALLRAVAAWVYLQHGASKLFGAFGGMGPNGGTVQLMSLFGLAGVIELGCGILILIGLFTRPAAFLASGEMAAAYFMVHAKTSLFITIQNHGEAAVLFAFVFLFISLYGPGPYSIDARLKKSPPASAPGAKT